MLYLNNSTNMSNLIDSPHMSYIKFKSPFKIILFFLDIVHREENQDPPKIFSFLHIPYQLIINIVCFNSGAKNYVISLIHRKIILVRNSFVHPIKVHEPKFPCNIRKRDNLTYLCPTILEVQILWSLPQGSFVSK